MPDKLDFVSTTNLLVLKNEELLLVKRSDNAEHFPGWCMLPGGKQEKDETPAQTAIRETYEETGIKALSPKLKIVATHLHEYKSKVYLVFIFTSDKFSGDLVESDAGRPVWMKLSDALEDPKLYPDLKRHIDIILKSSADEAVFTYHEFDNQLNIRKTV